MPTTRDEALAWLIRMNQAYTDNAAILTRCKDDLNAGWYWRTVGRIRVAMRHAGLSDSTINYISSGRGINVH